MIIGQIIYNLLCMIYLLLQAHRNLSQLPNFAFSVPLAMFYEAQQKDGDMQMADTMVRILLHNLLNIWKYILLKISLLKTILRKISLNVTSWMQGAGIIKQFWRGKHNFSFTNHDILEDKKRTSVKHVIAFLLMAHNNIWICIVSI